jgi:feruloyl-CoA synthase
MQDSVTRVMRDAVARDFAPAEVLVERRQDGSILLRSPRDLSPYGNNLGALLDEAATTAPDRTFLAERSGKDWRTVTFSQMQSMVRRVASALLRRKELADRPVAVLSDNSIEVAIITMAAIYAGIVVVPISPAYSKISQTHERLKAIILATNPALLYASDDETYGRAIRAAAPKDALVLFGRVSAVERMRTTLAEFAGRPADDVLLAEASARINRQTVAKIMFTSGSTGQPKGVVMTHGMLLAHAQGIADCWHFLDHDPPVMLDWLPWSHSFGGNANFLMTLKHKGSLFIDDGRPVPEFIERTVANLRAVSPTIMMSVPRSYAMLLPYLEDDTELARAFFRNLKVVFYAAADMSEPIWRRIEDLAARYSKRRPYFASAWGMSENVAAATLVHFPIERAGFVGIPVPGTVVKLTPVDDKMELRLRGPALTAGYLGRPDLTRAAFDDEGFYRSGDAGRLADPDNPNLGLAYDGRTSENFKLSSGRWVFVGDTRVRAVAAGSPIVDDVVVAAPDRDEVGLLVFLNVPASRLLAPELANANLSQLAHAPKVRQAIREMLRKISSDPQLRLTVKRAIILTEPPSIDGNETTDKAYLNQRAILTRRRTIVDRLYAFDDPDVILIET